MVKEITYQERLAIAILLKQGLSYNQIAIQMNRSKNGIRMEVVQNGGRESYDPDLANQRKDRVRKEKSLKVSETLIGKKKDFSIRERLDIIETMLTQIMNILSEKQPS